MFDFKFYLLFLPVNPAEDMSALNQCNHSIITLGTFSFWTGYLGPGLTVYPDLGPKKPPYGEHTYFLTRPNYEEAKMHDFIPIPDY